MENYLGSSEQILRVYGHYREAEPQCANIGDHMSLATRVFKTANGTSFSHRSVWSFLRSAPKWQEHVDDTTSRGKKRVRLEEVDDQNLVAETTASNERSIGLKAAKLQQTRDQPVEEAMLSDMAKVQKEACELAHVQHERETELAETHRRQQQEYIELMREYNQGQKEERESQREEREERIMSKDINALEPNASKFYQMRQAMIVKTTKRGRLIEGWA